jgi:uncharacterized membrane protein YbhN (UPF0104 family)
MIELVAPLEAARPLVGHLAAVSPIPLALAIGFQFLKLGALSGAWQRVLQSALPGTRVRLRDAVTPYMAGTGVSAIIPAKAGVATRVVLAKRLIPAASYETLAGTMVAESLLGLVPMAALFGIAAATGILPGATGGASLGVPAPIAGTAGWVVAFAAILGAIAAAAIPRLRARIAASLLRVREGLAILGHGRNLVQALAGQFAAWTFRLASIACFLAAFGLHPTAHLVLLVVMVQILAGLVPVAPNGAGAQEGLLVVALAGVASAGSVLAFGVGMQATLLIADVLVGAAALGLHRLTGGGGGWLLRRPQAEVPAVVPA